MANLNNGTLHDSPDPVDIGKLFCPKPFAWLDLMSYSVSLWYLTILVQTMSWGFWLIDAEEDKSLNSIE